MQRAPPSSGRWRTTDDRAPDAHRRRHHGHAPGPRPARCRAAWATSPRPRARRRRCDGTGRRRSLRGATIWPLLLVAATLLLARRRPVRWCSPGRPRRRLVDASAERSVVRRRRASRRAIDDLCRALDASSVGLRRGGRVRPGHRPVPTARSPTARSSCATATSADGRARGSISCASTRASPCGTSGVLTLRARPARRGLPASPSGAVAAPCAGTTSPRPKRPPAPTSW